MPTNDMPHANALKPEVPACDANKQQPKADLHTPNADVDANGHCIMPTYAETARAGTGEPCADGRNWPETEETASEGLGKR